MRGPLLGQATVMAALLALGTCLTGFYLCPHSIDCARLGRHFCRPGSSQCGPCLRPLVENSHGRCGVKRREHVSHSAQSSKGQMGSSYTELDEEIDFLSAVISEQRAESRLPAPPTEYVAVYKSKPVSESGPSLRASTMAQPMRRNTTFAAMASPTTTEHIPRLFSAPVIVPSPSNDPLFIIMSCVFIVTASLALIVAGICWVRMLKCEHVTQKVDFPAYGLINARTFDILPGDQRLALNAQMFHYQHQKHQMLSLEKHRDEPNVSDTGILTDEENEDGEFTVYECPGLAPTGEMEVKNPLFDDSTLYLQKFHK